MDDEVHLGRVGVFVLGLGAALVAGVLWLAAGLGGKREMDTYQGFIEESVAGLNVDAPVKYLGVDVGKVGRIGIDPSNSRRVRLGLLIDHGTPIKQDSQAVLKTQGLTGIAYIELGGGTEGSLPLQAGADGVPPTIPFKPSLSARLESVLGNVLGNVDRVSNNLNAVLDVDNRNALRTLLADLAATAHTLAGQQGVLKSGMADAARAARTGAAAAQELAPTMRRIAQAAQAVERMADTAGQAGERAGRAADAATRGAQQLGSETLPELQRLMAELEQLSASLRRLSEQTTQSPNSLLLGQPAPRPGPGERSPP
jgi:phospholipid/cholesterol/gamma-HCH transport system substrate-binding protein